MLQEAKLFVLYFDEFVSGLNDKDIKNYREIVFKNNVKMCDLYKI